MIDMEGEALDWSAFADLAGDRPGAVAGFAGAARPAVSRSFGAETPAGVALTARTPLYVASIAKQFTAAVIADLILDGVLRLHDSVTRWLPGAPPVRIEHLLCHTSGLADRGIGGRDELAVPMAERVDAITAARPSLPPGVVHRYSNDGYVLLAEIARRATGVAFGALAQARLFEPAGMIDSHFVDTAGHASAPGWIGRRERVDLVVGAVGDGGMVSTVADLIAWCRWLPAQPIAELMLSDRPLLPDGRSAHDAWGVSMRTHHGQLIHSHGGFVAGYLASMIRFPDLDAAFVALANTDHDGVDGFQRRVHRFVDSVLAEHLDFEMASLEHTHGLPITSRRSGMARDGGASA